MKILVTGGLGFIGHKVVGMLETLRHDVAIIDNKTNYGIIDEIKLHKLINERLCKIKTRKLYQIDITDVSSVNFAMKVYQPDIVIHLASFPRQKVVNSNPAAGSRVMSEGLLNLLEASAKNNVKKFVYVSSSMVYGNFNRQESINGIDETADCSPIGQYAILKLAGEMLVKDYGRKYNIDYTILRPSAVYGPLDVEDRVISKFLSQALRGEVLNVDGPDELLDFTHVDDTATGVALASISDYTSNATYNLSRGKAHTLLEAAELAVKIAGKGSIKINQRNIEFPIRGQLNNLRAHSDFGFYPTIDIDQGFREYYNWLEDYEQYI
jgi:nucleoside-diphosphate-sugar epimerase